MEKNPSTGHGVFTVGHEGYVGACGSLMDIERMCKAAYRGLVSA